MDSVTKRILIVEDEFFAALDLELLVHKHAPAAQVFVCSSVAEARMAAREPVGLALLDIDVLDGKTFEIAQALRRKATPVVFISGSRPEEIPPDLAEIPFIAKPFAAPVVQAAIEAILTSGAQS